LSDRKSGARSYGLATLFFIYGTVIEVTYVLAMIVMLRKRFRRLSCYKIMITLGSPAIVYVLLNRTIQREVLTLLGLRKRAIVNHLQSKLSGSRI
ncbi:hypothetical protein OESDEN_08584, partial [Oesophagostomum dentatum]